MRVGERHHRNQAAEMQAVGGGIEADIHGSPGVVQVLVEIVARDSVKKAAPSEFFEKRACATGRHDAFEKDAFSEWRLRGVAKRLRFLSSHMGFALPSLATRVKYTDGAGSKFTEQLFDCRGRRAVTRHHDSPFDVLAKFPGADCPGFEMKWRRLADLDHGPMLYECQSGRAIGPGPAHDEVIIAVYQNPQPEDSCRL